MAILNGGRPLDDKAFERAKTEAIEIILRGVAAGPLTKGNSVTPS
jgi:hypothetical protein